MTARYPVDLDRVDELLGLLSGAPLVDRPVLASQLAAEVPGLVAEVARMRPVVEAARRAVFPGGVDGFNGLIAAVSRFNTESPAVSAPEVPW